MCHFKDSTTNLCNVKLNSTNDKIQFSEVVPFLKIKNLQKKILYRYNKGENYSRSILGKLMQILGSYDNLKIKEKCISSCKATLEMNGPNKFM